MARQLRHEDYTVGWICALPIELSAAMVMLDEEHSRHSGVNSTQYTLGRIGSHNVVLVCLPAGQMGIGAAAFSAGQVMSSFPSIRFGLMVGVGGGAPSTDADVRLGDVVVSQPVQQHGGVVQYDFGKTGKDGKITRTGFLNAPPNVLLHAVTQLRANCYQDSQDSQDNGPLATHLSAFDRHPRFSREEAGPDVLFEATYHHNGGATCELCSKDTVVHRTARKADEEVTIHYGTIASGNQVIRDGATRDRLSEELGGVLCFEMEAAGLMNNFPCLVVRGICDYADSHKNKQWQPYAARTAAAYAKKVLSVIPPAEVANSRTAEETTRVACKPISPKTSHASGVHAETHKNKRWQAYAAGTAAAYAKKVLSVILPAEMANSRAVEARVECKPISPKTSHSSGVHAETQLQLGQRPKPTSDLPDELSLRWMKSFRIFNYDEEFQKIANERHPSTCSWVLKCEAVSSWRTQERTSSLWISGSPGAGKSIALASLVSDFPSHQSVHQGGDRSALAHSFCVDRLNSTASSVLSVVIHQLLVQFPEVRNSACIFDRDLYMVPIHRSYWEPISGELRPPFQLWNIIRHLIKEARISTLFLVVDALDECDQESQTKLFQLFYGSVPKDFGLKILFSSRTDSVLETLYSRYSTYTHTPKAWRHEKMGHFEDSINNDIELYIRAEVARIASLKYFSDKDQEQICKKLLSERSGVFLPVVFLLRELETRNDWSFEQVLNSIPSNLGSQYEKLFQHLSHDMQPEQKRTLKYLAYSIGDITPRDIAYACYTLESSQTQHVFVKGLDENHLNRTKRHLDSMSTIIRFQGDSAPVSLIHVTVKEYLTTLSGHRATSSILPKPYKAHTDIAITCLALIRASVKPKSQLVFPTGFMDAWKAQKLFVAIENIPFLVYALRNWYAHLKQAVDNTPENEEISNQLFSEIGKFVNVWNRPPDGFRYTLIRYSGIGALAPNEAEISIIEVFSAFGLTRCLKMLLTKDPTKFRSVNAQVRRAVLLAVQSGHESSFDLLVDHFKIASLDGPEFKEIITSSAWSGHFDVLEKILHLRHSTLEESVGATQVAFSTADHRILNRVKADGAIFGDTNGQKRTALHLLFLGSMTTFSVLDNNTDVSQGLVLAQAEFYVNHGVNINAHDRYGFTALHYACYTPQLCKRDLLIGLIALGADPMLTTKGGLTPLHFAARFARHPSAIQVLLDVTCNKLANVQSLGGNTPLHFAVQRQGIRIEQKMNVRAFEDGMKTMPALPGIYGSEHCQGGYAWEASSPSSVIWLLLLNGGADPHTRNKCGFSPLDRIRHPEVGPLLKWGHAHPDIVSTFVAFFRQLNPTPETSLRICERSMKGSLAKGLLSSVSSEENLYLGTLTGSSRTTETFYTAIQTDEGDTHQKIQKKQLWKSWQFGSLKDE